MKKYFLLLVLVLSGLVFFLTRPKSRINTIQIIGSHNSYKEYIDTPLYVMIKNDDSISAIGLEYSNSSLSDQLSIGLRSLEIDVYADAAGGKYAHPGGLTWAGNNPIRPFDPDGIMKEPGFKVLHVQDIDFRSNCLTLKKCLQELKSWSDDHPGHEPIFITVNAKDDTIKKPEFTLPEKFTRETFDQLDTVILTQMSSAKLITPDMVRGKFESLEEAVLNINWPKMEDAKGKFIFILDEEGAKLAEYTKHHPALKKRALFVNAPAGKPEAAILIINDPVKNLQTIRELVKKGYIVRTRADADTREARINDKSRFIAACNSGAQIISTDYYAKSKLFKSDYKISFENGKYARANPVVK